MWDWKSFIRQNENVKRTASVLCTRILGFNRIHLERGNQINLKGAFLRKCRIHVKGKENCILIAKDSYLQNCSISITGNHNRVIIGPRVSALNCEIHMEDHENVANIGENCRISGHTHLACIEGCHITLGKDCLLSSEITFRTGDSHSIMDSEGNRINFSKDITIGNHVWIGNKVILTKGVSVSDNSIIATGSIVTKQFTETNIIVGGIPARVLKQDINWTEARVSK